MSAYEYYIKDNLIFQDYYEAQLRAIDRKKQLTIEAQEQKDLEDMSTTDEVRNNTQRFNEKIEELSTANLQLEKKHADLVIVNDDLAKDKKGQDRRITILHDEKKKAEREKKAAQRERNVMAGMLERLLRLLKRLSKIPGIKKMIDRFTGNGKENS